MLQKKKIYSVFTVVFLSCVAALVLVTTCNVFGKEPSRLTMKDQKRTKDNYTSGLNIGWQTKYKRLNFKSIAKFLKEENIQMVSFIDDKGTMYIADRNGKEIGFEQKDGRPISKWCTLAGTQIEDGCLNLKTHTITNINNMTTIVGHGSPYQIIIQVDGHAVCWDLVEQKICD